MYKSIYLLTCLLIRFGAEYPLPSYISAKSNPRSSRTVSLRQLSVSFVLACIDVTLTRRHLAELVAVRTTVQIERERNERASSKDGNKAAHILQRDGGSERMMFGISRRSVVDQHFSDGRDHTLVCTRAFQNARMCVLPPSQATDGRTDEPPYTRIRARAPRTCAGRSH